MTSTPTTSLGEILFSWIHLSDIHIGHGNAAHGWDQKLVLKALRDDVAKLVGEGSVPRPAAMLVTGDIAFSGATRKPTEYADAREWLLSVAAAAGIAKEDVFVVPGNHDVQRRVDKEDRDVSRLVRALRRGESIDEALGDRADAALLKKRMARYLTFAASFAPMCRAGAEPPRKRLYWCHERSAGGGIKLRIAGLNTALLAADAKDQGKLRLGKAQLAHALLDGARDDKTIVLVLTHHPFRDGWLADEAEVASWMRNHASIHLSGHVHVADAEQVVTGGGTSFIHVTAGAAHGDAEEKAVPASHGYNVAALVRSPSGGVQLAIWPRRWSPTNTGFRVDVHNVPDRADHTLHEIAGVKAKPSAKAAAAPPAASPARRDLALILDELPVAATFGGRSALLTGVPIASAINRSADGKLLDLQLIVNQLRPRKLADGRRCLAVVIDNALGFAAGTDLVSPLLVERDALDAG
jgi:3',5'-cyclic AMP phosphodiesterase CpdA